MLWTLNKERAICPQIYEQICLRIASGEVNPNDKLMSVREVAVAAGVNPNTVQRAFERLEQDGILYSVRGSGWYVAGDTDKANSVYNKIIADKTANYFKEMNALGFSAKEVKKYIKEWYCE